MDIGESSTANNVENGTLVQSTAWRKDNANFSVNVEYDPYDKIVSRRMDVVINMVEQDLDIARANDLHNTYFNLSVDKDFSCTTYDAPLDERNIIVCETLWIQSDGLKRGVVIQSPFFVENPVTLLSICEFRKDSTQYNWESCRYGSADIESN